MIDPKFIHLRCKTLCSIGQSSLKITDIINLCTQNFMPAISLTDCDNMFAAREFSAKVASYGIKPIMGIDILVNFTEVSSNTSYSGYLVLLAKNERGYRNLLKIHDIAYKNKAQNFLKSPEIDILNLLDFSEDVVLLTAGVEGLLNKIVSANIEHGRIFLSLLKQKSVDSYIEINRIFTQDDFDCEPKLLSLAKDLDLPIVATNNVVFATPEEYTATDILMCIGQSVKQSDESRKVLNAEVYFKTQDQMIDLFQDLPEAIENTVNIAKKCNFYVEKQELSLPKFSDDEDNLIVMQAQDGLRYRLESEVYNRINEAKEVVDKIYQERLDFELSIIKKMGFAGYFLIVSDFIKWAKQNDIPVGPGRGSGAGSLVAWVLLITDVDPLRFSLLFERFLNPERVSMPDFDIDFCNNRRDEVIEYVRHKYGIDKVSHIITFGTLQTKAALKDVGRALGMSYSEVDQICKKIPHSAPSNPVTLSRLMNEESEVKQEIEQKPSVKYLFEVALKLEGSYRNISTHAAGVVISKDSLNESAPLFYDDGSDFPSVGFTMKYIEDVGMVKFDFLALKTLTIIDNAVKTIKVSEGIDIDVLKIPYEDENISKLFSNGDCLGLFQLESKGMIDVLKQLRPDKIEDIIAIIALYRPGPMENIPTYINRKHGKETVDHLHPKMEIINQETFGIMVYQEQVMQVAQAVAGYTLGGADLLRRAMGKKDPAEMDKQRSIFVDGAKNTNNIDSQLASDIFDQMEKFAGYGFNKSHATAYAMVSWQTAYLKAYYPAEFLASSMSSDIGSNNKDISRFLEFLEESKKYNIKMRPPSVNAPSIVFSIEKDEDNNKAIRYCLLAIKGISENTVNELTNEIERNGKFKSIEDLLSRVPPKYLNRKQLESFIVSGALDEFESNRKKLYVNIDKMLSYNHQTNEEKNSSQIGLFSFGDSSENLNKISLILEDSDNWSYTDQMTEELQVIGCFLSGHPLTQYKELIDKIGVISYNELMTEHANNSFIAGYLMKIKVSKSKNGQLFASLTFYDQSSVFNLALFGNNYEKYKEILQEGNTYIIKTNLKITEDEVKVFIEKIDLFTSDYKATKSIEPVRKSENIIFKINSINELSIVKNCISDLNAGNDTMYLHIKSGDSYLLFSLSNISLNYNQIKQQQYNIFIKYEDK